MAIAVATTNVSTSAPVAAEMTDASGADVELFLFVGDLPPIHQAFSVTTGTASVPLDLPLGKHKCALVVTAFRHKNNMNRMYKVQVNVNGSLVAKAKGNIPASRTNDTGSGDFTITVA